MWIFTDEITSGRVRIILDAFEPSALPIHAVYPSRRLVSSKVQAVIEFLATEFAASPLPSGVAVTTSSVSAAAPAAI